MKIIFSIIGIFLGAWIGEWENDPLSGAAYGFFIGLLTGSLINTKRRMNELEGRLAGTGEHPVDGRTTTVTEETDITPTPTVDSEAITEVPDRPAAAASVTEETATETATGRREETAEDEWESAPSPTIPPISDNPVFRFFKRFFTSGNVVVKVGVILLFFGVSFLVKYAAERNVFPIELRLAGVAAGAIVMLIIGWRLRLKNANYALVLQGGAVGILYLTVFAAAKLYGVVPYTLAFFIMFGLVIFSSLLAVIQDSRSLAIFATAGGFLAPILTSSGGGSHVALFSYYALLNAGVFGIAWYKSWRSLNWVGFIFTFVIGSLWGIQYYRPEHFNTTEPFLILFFLFYVGIAVLFAHRQPPQLKGLVDGTLVFGTPLVGFTLQNALVRDFAFGQAYSALGIGAIYALLASLLWRKQIEGMRMLTESFLALAVIFLSLAIPFVLDDGRWTAAAWALEGAGITWIGIRQHRLLARLFGLLLQLGAGLAFFSTLGHPHGNWPVLNSDYIGSIMIAIAGLFIGLQYFRRRQDVREPEKDIHILLLIWGLLWWFGAGFMEIDYHVAVRYELNTHLFFIAASFLALTLLAQRLDWPAAQLPAVLLLPAMILIALFQFTDGVNPFARLGFISWIAAFVSQYLIFYRAGQSWKRDLLATWHAGSLYVFIFIIAWAVAHAVSRHIPGLHNWAHIFWGLVPALAVFMMIYLKPVVAWPLREFAPSYTGTGLLPVMIYLGLWIVAVCFRSGDPAPLPYLPVVNPQDIVQLFALLSAIEWVVNWKKERIPAPARVRPRQVMAAVAAVFFIWLNSLVAHGVHFYAGVPYAIDPIFDSELFQTAVSIVWTLTAFILMGVATRMQLRIPWFTGAALLAAVVLKLFIIDLDDSGTVTRIISFMSVGGLMLLIGYFSPLPPKTARAAD